jgi:hypothetical protein
MAEGRGRAAWDIASSLMALVANCHRDPKRRPFRPRDFNPWAASGRSGGIPLTKENARILKQVFVDGKGGGT